MDKDLPPILEDQLSAGLQPIRQFVLAHALYHFMNTGLQATIAGTNDYAIHSLAHDLKMHERRLRGFLQYLANEGYVRLGPHDMVSLTPTGEEIATFRPWYALLVGGYATTFQQLSAVLQEDGPYATRNSFSVGVGSCGISQYDALPMTRRLLTGIAGKWRTVVDLGCGDGSYLVDLCRSMPGVRGIGLDPEPQSVTAALQTAERYGILDRVDVRIGSATALPDLSHETGPLCFITAFVLQEVLEQSGRAAVVKMLKDGFDRYPDAHWIVIEVDHRPDDPAVMTKGLGLAYYNPYYLIHYLTEQRLERIAFWEDVFRDAGVGVQAIEHPDPTYDSLALKTGFLLTRESLPGEAPASRP